MLKCPLCGCQGRALAAVEHYFACSNCALHFVDPKAHLAPLAEKARYDRHRNNPGDAGYTDFLRPLVGIMQQRVPAGACGLDFGSGPYPALAEMLRHEGFTMDLYDPFYWPENPRQTYDFIVSSEVVEHFRTPDREFRRLYDLLKPGGWLGIMTLLLEPTEDFASWHYRRDPTHVVFYTRSTFQWISEHHGMVHLTYSGERIVLLQRPLCGKPI